MCESCKRLIENDKKELMEGCDYQNDLTSAEDLYEYLAEESAGFSLIARKEPLTN